MPEKHDMDLVAASRKLIAKMRRWKSLKRIHVTNVPDLTLVDMPKPGIEMKPGMGFRHDPEIHRSFWYGFNDSWLEWCRGEHMDGWFQPYVYEILVDESKVLRIENEQQFEAFEDEYHGCPDFMQDVYGKVNRDGKYRSIDYGRLAEKYGGLEIVPYLWPKRLESIWYYSWDCASGCIWDKSIVNVKLIASYNAKSDKFE